MTLDYKILGQLYYGPEINETPEIPGTSGYYTSVTGSTFSSFIAFRDPNYYPEENGFYTSLDGSTWSLQPSSFDFDFSNKVICGNGKAVSMRNFRDFVLYSEDGINWTSSNIGYTYDRWSLAFGDGKFVLIGSDCCTSRIYTSVDAITWTLGTMPTGSWRSVTYGNGKFVAVDHFNFSYSTDGVTWTSSTLPAGDLYEYYSRVVYGNNIFVAITDTGNHAYSYNAINWTRSNLPESGQYFWTDLIYANNRFIITPDDGDVGANFILWSEDGIDWYQAFLPVSRRWSSVAYGNNKFILTSKDETQAVTPANTKIFSSTDGSVWNEEDIGFEANFWSISFIEINTLQEVQISIGGQGTPGSYVEITEPQVLYTVPTGTETTVTSIYVTNHDSVQRTYDLAVVPEGETLSLKHHIRWDMPVSGSDFDVSNAKLTLSAGDTIYVFPSTINQVGFTAFGVEKS